MTTDANGNYRFDGVLAGIFSVDAFDPVTGRRGKASGEIKPEDHNKTITANMIQLPLGNVAGSVVMDATGAPVVGAEVTLSIQGAIGGTFYATTDKGGNFQFSSVPAGQFTVRATDYISELSASTAGSFANEGQTATANLRLKAVPVGTVSGTVSGTAGSPVTGAVVRLFPLAGGHSPQTTVNSQGIYRFDNVPLGKFKVQATPQLGGDLAEGGGELTFAGDSETIDLQFRGSASLNGTVQGWAGGSVAGTEVTLTRKDKQPPHYNQTVTSDANGSFTFHRVPLGDYDITANQRIKQLGGSAMLTLTVPDVSKTITVSLEPAGAITGTVVYENSTTPAARMALELTSADGTVKRYGSTDNNGAFRFDDLKLTGYSLHVSDPLGTGFVDATGSLVSAGQILSLGNLMLDNAPPTVIAITPANGSIGVPVTQTISVNFSEPVQAATVNSTDLVVSTSSGPITGTWTLNAERTLATFTPGLHYKDFATVSLRVKTGIKDRVGRTLAGESVSSFTTTDATPPSILTRSPLAGAQGVPVTSLVRVQWSEIIDPTKFQGAAVTLTRNGVAVPLARPVEIIQNNTVAVLTPLDPLESDTLYTVTVQPATDRFGNKAAAVTTYTFRTQDLVAPVLQYLASRTGTSVRSGSTALITAALEIAPTTSPRLNTL